MNPFPATCLTNLYKCKSDERIYRCGVPAMPPAEGFECDIGTLSSLWVPAGRWLCVPVEGLLPVQLTDAAFKEEFEICP